MEFRRLLVLVAVAGLLANSLDCYGAWITSKQARRCCNSGHCSPANHDPCCKIAPAGGSQPLLAQQNVHVTPPIASVSVAAQAMLPILAAAPKLQPIVGCDMPPPLEFRSTSLPLLI